MDAACLWVCSWGKGKGKVRVVKGGGGGSGCSGGGRVLKMVIAVLFMR